jgi:lysozyme family protein
MYHPFSVLAPEYASWWQTMHITKMAEAVAAAKHLLRDRDAYEAASKASGVPAVLLMGLNWRESDGSLNTYLGNGDHAVGPAAMKAHRRTVNVPRGRGPFPDWQTGAIDALHYDRLDQVKNWTIPLMLYEGELWNGFGYRSHGVRTPYLVGGTSLQQRGRYAGDGNWQAGQWDSQIGIMPVMWCVMDATPELKIPFGNVLSSVPPTPVVPVPDGHGGADHWLTADVQLFLNTHLQAGLKVDGSYGRRTAAAVRAFQLAHPPLDADGLAGPATIAAMKAALAPVAA